VQVTNYDDEKATVVITPVNNNTAESDTLASNVGGAFDVTLLATPSKPVLVHIDSTNEAEGVVFADDASLTFTPASWNVPQTVHMLGVDDLYQDGDTAYKVVVSTDSPDTFDGATYDAKFAGLRYEVDMINLDNNVASVYATILKGNTSEAGDSGSFILKLATIPTASVIFAISSSDIDEAMVLPSIVVLAADNWDLGVEVTATGMNSNKGDGDTGFNITVMSLVSDDPLYRNQPALHVPFVNIENPINKFLLSATTSPAACRTSESGGECDVLVTATNWFSGGEGFSAFKKVSVTLTTGDPTEGKPVNSAGAVADSVVVEFNASTSATNLTVVIRGVDDSIEDFNVSYHISLTATIETEDGVVIDISADKVTTAVGMVNVDNDEAGLVISMPSGLQTTESGDMVTFTARLRSEPSQSVSLQVLSNSTEAAVTTGATLTFTPANWNTAQLVRVTGQDDATVDGDQYYHIYGNSASTDVAYDSLNFVQPRMTNQDNDKVSTSLHVMQFGEQLAGKLSQNVDETGSSTTFQVGLSAAPSADATVLVTSGDPTEGLVSPASLVFNTSNWAAMQNVTVTGQDDLLDDDNSVFTIDLSVVSQDTALNGTLWRLRTVNMEDDVLRLSQHSCTTSETGGSCTVEVSIFNWLTSFEQIEIFLASSDTTEGTISVSHIVIESGNWSSPTVVTITGVDDFMDDGDVPHQMTLNATLKYKPAGANASITKQIRSEAVQVINTNNDTAGLNVVQLGTETNEAGTTKCNVSVVLLTEPLQTAILDPSEGTFDSSSLHFYKFNWNVPQTIVVSGVNDFIKDGDIVYQINIVGGDAFSGNTEEYQGVAQSLSFTNLDDDVVAINVEMIESVSTESGDKASFKITLNSEPIAAVIYTLSTDDASEGQVETSIIVALAPDNWNTGVLVEVKGQPDDEVDGDVVYHIAITPVVSDDPGYKALPIKQVELTNLDDVSSLLQISMSPTQCVVNEDGGSCPILLSVAGWYMGDVYKVRDKYRYAFKKLTLVLTSTDVGEGLLNCAAGDNACVSSNGDSAGISVTVVFTAGGTKTVDIVGQDDAKVDGDIQFLVGVSGTLRTGDDVDSDVHPVQFLTKQVLVVNMDSDGAGLVVTSHCPTGGIRTTELGDFCRITAKLSAEPPFGLKVIVDASSTDLTEGTVSNSTGSPLVLDSTNWNTGVVVTVTGMEDSAVDGDQSYNVTIVTTCAQNEQFNALTSTSSFVNMDNDVGGSPFYVTQDGSEITHRFFG
jgi:hypothetical protein